MEKKFTNESKLYRVVAVCCCVCIISAFSWFCSAVKWSAGVYYLDVKKLLTMFINILNWLPTDDQFSTFPVGFVFFQEHVFQSDVANSTYSNNPCYHLVVQFKFTNYKYVFKLDWKCDVFLYLSSTLKKNNQTNHKCQPFNLKPCWILN